MPFTIASRQFILSIFKLSIPIYTILTINSYILIILFIIRDNDSYYLRSFILILIMLSAFMSNAKIEMELKTF